MITAEKWSEEFVATDMMSREQCVAIIKKIQRDVVLSIAHNLRYTREFYPITEQVNKQVAEAVSFFAP